LIPPTPCVISANLPAQAVRSVSIASNSHGKLSMGINTTVSFVKAATRGNLYAEAQEQAINRKLASYHVHVTDDDNDVVALFQGMVYRKNVPLIPSDYSVAESKDQG